MTRDRGTYGSLGRERNWTVGIGQELFHTVADRERAITQLSTGFRALANDLGVWLSSNTAHPAANTIAQWFAADVTPTLEEWNKFAAHENKSWWTKVATNWDTFEQWWGRLKQLRSLALAHGVSLQSTEPVSLPKTIWQRSEEGKGSEATAILGVLKLGALATLSIMGAAGLYSAIRNLRAKAQSAEDQVTLRQIVREEVRAAVKKTP